MARGFVPLTRGLRLWGRWRSSGGEPAGSAPETLVQPTRADGEAPQGGEVAGAVDAQARPKLDGEIVYFVMLDRFADGDEKNNFDVKKGDKGAYQGGDLAGLTQKLDYLAELGVTTVWITPIVDQVDMPVTGAGFPDWAYHGYWGDDFERLDRHLGDEGEQHDQPPLRDEVRSSDENGGAERNLATGSTLDELCELRNERGDKHD